MFRFLKQSKLRPDYGIDAPWVLCNLFFIGIFSPYIIFYFSSWLYVRYHVPLFWFYAYIVPFMVMASFLLTVLLMVWSSLYGKEKQREKILKSVVWRGDEQVLDVGCGRGLFLIGAAQRLRGGKAVDVDIWQQADLSGNSREAVFKNVKVAEVEDKVEIVDGDAQDLPFADATFDLVLSSLVIHNISTQAGRRKALSEIVRILKPGGKVIVQDIFYAQSYKQMLEEQGLNNVTCPPYQFLIFPPARYVSGIRQL